jgi:hypothetical protein
LPRRRVLAATAPADHRTPAANAMLTVLTTLGAEIGRPRGHPQASVASMGRWSSLRS